MGERKVIQVTENGIFLCNDGSMWERKIDQTNGDGERVHSWVYVEDVPQPTRIRMNENGEIEEVGIFKFDLESLETTNE